MLTISDALNLVLMETVPLLTRTTSAADAMGLVLAEQVVSDVDSPPHDKAIVDGYALQAASVTVAGAELQVLEEVTAGALPTKIVTPGAATRIMTGAPIPDGADAVVMVEQTELLGDRVRIQQAHVKPGQNIVRRAASLKRGQTVLSTGRLLRAIEIGLLAEVGRTSVDVFPRPSVATLATGNELLDCSQMPGPGQIRNSNGPLLAALACSAGATVKSLGIARDEATDLERAISTGLSADVLILSGGVSAGVLDLVPATLARLGVRQVFHKVNLKPGKPLWFGIFSRADQRQTLVFGLPGNPVSTLVCFVLFALPAIQKLRGLPPVGLPRRHAELTTHHAQRGERPTYWPAQLNDQQSHVAPLAWQGSGDLRTLTDANCLAYFPPGERTFSSGEVVEVLLLAS